MQTRLLSIRLMITTTLLLFSCLGYSQGRLATVYLHNGDRITGDWLASDDKTLHVVFQEKNLEIELNNVSTIRFVADLNFVPDARAEKHFHNAKSLLDLGLRDQAKRQFEAAIEEFPKHADAHYQLGLLLREDGAIDEALDSFGRVAKIAPQTYNLVTEFKDAADSYLAEDAYREAVDTYLLIFNYYQTHSEAENAGYTAGFLLAERLDASDEALNILQAAARLFPVSDNVAKAKYLIGVMHSRNGQPQIAVESLTEFIQEYPDSEWLDDAYVARGSAFQLLRMNEEALVDFTEANAITTDPLLRATIQRKREESAWTVYRVSDDLPSNNIQAIAVNGDDLWVGTPKGLARVDISLGKWQVRPETEIELINNLNPKLPTNVRALVVYPPTIEAPSPSEADEITPSVIEQEEADFEVWIGTLNQGVIRYFPSSGTFANYNKLKGLPHNQISDIKCGPDDVWIATYSGVARYSRSKDEWKTYDRETDGLPADNIVALAVTPETVWAGTSGAGLAIFDLVYVQSWRSSNLHDIVPEVSGNSIASFDVSGQSVYFTWFNQKDWSNGYGEADWKGLQGVGMTITRQDIVPIDNIYIAVDRSAESETSPPLWFATNDAVYIKSESGWDSIGYPVEQIGDTVTVNCIELGRETAWIGTSNGLAKIDTNALSSQ
ncbi:MAG: tetratricopeptide repeat protein [Candidatus Poribacteria bacterium]|nr:tetratricopeptide repeat protein [Candidatus Poribacteria bacterium]MDE0506571.1 tetratricopeptide repeat protein [Candidatus Poribacteria bacterium]